MQGLRMKSQQLSGFHRTETRYLHPQGRFQGFQANFEDHFAIYVLSPCPFAA
jgi:hypothetical protein